MSPPRPLEGKLAPNERLNNAEKLFENQIHGPEAVVKHKNELYMGVHGGHIVKLEAGTGQLVPVAKLGKPCCEFTGRDVLALDISEIIHNPKA